MGLIHGGMRHWLDRGNGIDSWGHAMGPCVTGWVGVMGLIHGGARPWLDRGYGFDWWSFATLAGTRQWHWFMGMRHGGARQDGGDGIDLWGHAIGVRHWLDVGNGIELWGHAMGARDWIGVCGTGWIGALGLIHGDVPNDKVIWLPNLNDDTVWPHVWRWGKCAECVWLRGW